MPRQFAFRGDRLAYQLGDRAARGRRAGCCGLRRRHARSSSRSTRSACSCASRSARPGWSGTGSGVRSRAGVAPRLNASAAVLTASSSIVVVVVKFVAGAYLVVILVPVLVAMMLFIGRQYAPLRQQLAVRSGVRRRAAAARGAGRGSRSPASTGRSSRPSTSAARSRRRPGRLHLRRPRGRAGDPRRLGAAGAGRPAGGRRVARIARWRARCSPTSTCSTRPGRRTSPTRSRSSSSPSTSRAAGGSGSSTTSPRSGCARACSAAATRSSSTSRIGARTPRRRRKSVRRAYLEPSQRPGREQEAADHDDREIATETTGARTSTPTSSPVRTAATPSVPCRIDGIACPPAAPRGPPPTAGCRPARSRAPGSSRPRAP